VEQVSGQRGLLTKDPEQGQVQRNRDRLREVTAFNTRPQAYPDPRARRDQVSAIALAPARSQIPDPARRTIASTEGEKAPNTS
jgi:hypothetical protein